jgi:hypothetical protein
MDAEVLVCDLDAVHAGLARERDAASFVYLELGVERREGPVERAGEVADGEADPRVDRIEPPCACESFLRCCQSSCHRRLLSIYLSSQATVAEKT